MNKENGSIKSDLETKYAAMSLQDKRKKKYEEKKDFYEICKMEVDQEESNYEKNLRNNLNMPKEVNMNFNQGFNNNFEQKQSIFESKEDPNMLCDSTPQQYFNRRTPFEGQLGVFASPLEVPKRSLHQREMRGNNSYTMIKPIASPSITKQTTDQSKSIEQKSQNNSDDTLMNLLKICESKESKINQLKLIKKLLCEFRDFDDSKKDKTLINIENLMINFDSDLNSSFNQQLKPELKMNSTTSSVISFENKANNIKEIDQKQLKTGFGINKSSRVKNTLFGIHKEEANNITKVSKSIDNSQPKAPKIETFQSPAMTSAFDSDKKMMSGFTRMGGNMQPNGTPCMITPLYESTPRMLDQMPTSMYGGMSCFDQPNQMRECLIQSPSPNFRMGGKFNPETPQNAFHARTNTWQKDSMSLFYPNSPLLSFNGRNNMVQRMNPMDNPNSIFRNKWNE